MHRWTLALRPQGIHDVPAELQEGRVVYREAWFDTDDLVLADESSMEEWLVLRSEAAPSRFTWAVDLPAGLSGARADLDGGLTFVDSSGRGVLRVLPALASDAAGATHEVQLAWDPIARELHAEVDHAAWPHPVLVDPGWVESASWTQVFPTTSPAPRSAHVMAYHPVKQRVFLFGGYGCTSPGNCQYLPDTWSWDSTNKTWLAESAGPTARAYASMTGNVDMMGMFLFGGESSTGTDLNDLWEMTDGAWMQLAATSAPTGRAGHALVSTYRENLGPRLALIGGASSGALATTQHLFAQGTTEWTLDNPPSYPPVRDAVVVSTDNNNSVLLFGGLKCATPSCATSPNTYRLSSLGNWSQVVQVGVAPGARYAAASTYDTARGRVVLHGGRTSSGVCYADMFEATSTRWYSRSVGGAGPGARAFHAMAYDPISNSVIAFGGTKSLANTMPSQLTDHLDDTWILKITSGACTDSSQCGLESCVDGACCEQAACGPCETCGSSTDPGYCVPVKNGPDDGCSGTCDATGKCLLALGSACGVTDTCLNGVCASGICCDSQCTDPCAQCTTGTCSPKAQGDQPTTSCGDLLCSGDSVQCPSSCLDAPCKAPLLCGTDGQCYTTLPDGMTCGVGTECTSGNCVEGVCCNQACDQPCDTCLASRGASAQGACGPVTKGLNPDPADACGGKTCPGVVTACACSAQVPCPSGLDCNTQTGVCETPIVDAGLDSADTGTDGPEQDSADADSTTPPDSEADSESGTSEAAAGSKCDYGYMKQSGACVPVPGPFDPATPSGGFCSVSNPTGRAAPGLVAWLAGGLIALTARRRSRGKERA